MQSLPRNAWKMNVSDNDDDSLIKSVVAENSFVHKLQRSHCTPDTASISDSADSVFLSNPSSPDVNPSATIHHSTTQIVSNSEVNSKPDETQISNSTTSNESDFSQSNTSNLPFSHYKSVDDLLKKSPVQNSTNLSRACISSSDLRVDDDSDDDDDYVIPFLHCSDKDDGYVIASLISCPNEYLKLGSDSSVDGFEVVENPRLQTTSLSSSTTCDIDSRARSDSYDYDYVRDFTLPTLPLCPVKAYHSAKHNAVAKLNSDTNEHDKDKISFQETPSSCSTNSTYVEDNHPNSDYEEVKDYI